jgi:hypothetical protein
LDQVPCHNPQLQPIIMIFNGSSPRKGRFIAVIDELRRGAKDALDVVRFSAGAWLGP